MGFVSIRYWLDSVTDYMCGEYKTQLKHITEEHIEVQPYPLTRRITLEPMRNRMGERQYEEEKLKIRVILEKDYDEQKYKL